MAPDGPGTPFDAVALAAAGIGERVSAAEVADFAERLSLGEAELGAVASALSWLAERHREQRVASLLRASRLPQKSPRTFEGFDFSRIRGKDAKALGELPRLSQLYARRNVALVGPCGIGKTHLAQAFGRECCLRGFRTRYFKATELRDKLSRALVRGTASRAVQDLVNPACLIVDEVGRCTFDRACTDLFFDIVDRRYEKDGPNSLVLTSNTPASEWGSFFTGGDTLLCTLDRIFDSATVFVMKGTSFRGKDMEVLSVETTPMVARSGR